MDQLIYKHALYNAIHYEGKANTGSVIGRVLSENPEFKMDMKSLGKKISEVIKMVNSMKLEKQIQELEKIAPELLKEEKKIEERVLPPLPNVRGHVTLRVAPYPSGPLHIGNAKTI